MSQTTLTEHFDRPGDAPTPQPTKTLLALCPGVEFMVKYLAGAFGEQWRVITRPEEGTHVDAAVMISSTDIYDVAEGRDLDEDAPLKAESPLARDEAMFAEYCRRHALPCLILRPANIVGTGMTGLPMRMARGVARGTLMHIGGNSANISVVHAMDVARLSVEMQSAPGIYNVTDGTDTTVDAFIEALAHRIKDKNVGTLRPRWARWLYGRRYYDTLTRTLTFDTSRLRRALEASGRDTAMTNVVQRLNTHQYGQDDI